MVYRLMTYKSDVRPYLLWARQQKGTADGIYCLRDGEKKLISLGIFQPRISINILASKQ